MADLGENHQNEFMIEKIKERPVNKKKLLRRTLITASMAVIFGLIACFTFLVLEPVISNWLYPEEEPQVIVFPEDQEEMSPEEMLSDNMQAENQETETEAVLGIKEEEFRRILSEIAFDKSHYEQVYAAMSDYVDELNGYMVTITGVTSNIDWFNDVQESKNQSSGIIIANNGRELLILADNQPVEEAERLSLTFHNGVRAEAFLKQKDSFTGLAVLAVNLEDLPEEGREDIIQIAKLGSSNVAGLVGTPVVAVGSPMGMSGSVGYGIVTARNSQFSVADRSCKLLLTDIYGSQDAGGVLFDLQGQVLGIITSNKTGSDMKNVINAYGITELKKVIEKMSNGRKLAYAGVTGVDVTKEANRDLDVPFGAYVKEVDMDSPAMLAGIQQGDVIVEMNGRSIDSYEGYTGSLLQMEAGDTVNFKVMRLSQDEYKEMSFNIVLGEQE